MSGTHLIPPSLEIVMFFAIGLVAGMAAKTDPQGNVPGNSSFLTRKRKAVAAHWFLLPYNALTVALLISFTFVAFQDLDDISARGKIIAGLFGFFLAIGALSTIIHEFRAHTDGKPDDMDIDGVRLTSLLLFLVAAIYVTIVVGLLLPHETVHAIDTNSL